jgi:hypothetical protein
MFDMLRLAVDYPSCRDSPSKYLPVTFANSIGACTSMDDESKFINRLVLHPAQAEFAPASWQPIKRALREIGFLGARYRGAEEQRYLVGDNFLHLVTLMGCSPNISMQPPEGRTSLDFCHIQFSQICPQVRFRSRRRDVFARCPHCRRRLADWRLIIDAWQEDPFQARYTCHHCASVGLPYELGWNKKAGFARLFIDVYNIFPQEGIPGESLLAALAESSDQSWDYFYSDR